MIGSIVGGMLDFTGDGVSVTPFFLDAAGDVDGVDEPQSASAGPATANLGVDVGLAAAGGPGDAGALYPYGPYAAGPGPGPGPFTTLTAELAFSFSGGGDIFSVNGFASINPVPEPSSFLLLGVAQPRWGSAG